MDIVYFQGPTQSEELRYSLRSIAANVPHERVFFLGEPPAWVHGVTVIDAGWPTSKWYALHAKNRLLSNPRTPWGDKITVFDDDMYVLKPVDEIPAYFEGWLTPRNMTGRGSFGWIVDNSIAFLKEQGIPYPLKIATHVPRVYRRDSLQDLAAKDPQTEPFLWRYVYGNMYTEPTHIPVDVKAYSVEDFTKVQSYDTGFLSSHESSFDTLREYLEGRFPDKCDYERD